MPSEILSGMTQADCQEGGSAFALFTIETGALRSADAIELKSNA